MNVVDYKRQLAVGTKGESFIINLKSLSANLKNAASPSLHGQMLCLFLFCKS